MPHALPLSSPGLQALILCGPGHAFDTFTVNPEDLPKALLPIANRPMVWYSLDWCYRMGITNINLITPRSAQKALETALSQNPYLTSLPLPRANVLAPQDLTQTSGTAELLRHPEIQSAVKGNFIVVPCDLVCDIPGEFFIDTWMSRRLQFNPGNVVDDPRKGGLNPALRMNNDCLTIWYRTVEENPIETEDTDFLITTPIETDQRSTSSSNGKIELCRVVYTSTTATLKDIAGDEELLPIRHGLVRRFGRVKALSTYRDSHFYIFPYWILELIKQNIEMDSINEDVVGSIAKSTWQKELALKLGLPEMILWNADTKAEKELSLDINAESLAFGEHKAEAGNTGSGFSNRGSKRSSPSATSSIFAYLHQNTGESSLMRRVDNPALLLSVSLRLAKLMPSDDMGQAASPLAHPSKIVHPSGIAAKSTVTKIDCLVGDNVTVEEKCVIKESVIGANCQIKSGSRITKCVLMEGVIISEKCQLTGCIIGKRAQIGRDSNLRDCEIQNGNQVSASTEAKGEKFIIFEGLEISEEDDKLDFDSNDLM